MNHPDPATTIPHARGQSVSPTRGGLRASTAGVVFLVALHFPAGAQILGGPGQGFDHRIAYNLALDNNPAPIANMLGGNGDGFGRASLSNARLDSAPETNEPFFGTSGDGFGNLAAQNLALDSIPTPPEPFVGGFGDGFVTFANYNLPLDGTLSELSPYRGTAGDGYANSPVFNLSLDGSLPLNTFVGGSAGDGFHSSTTYNLPLDGSLLVAFPGGLGDGFGNSAALNFALDGIPSLTEPFGGGPGDGFGREISFNLPLNAVLAVGPYFGGAGDGHDHLAAANHQLLGLVNYAQWAAIVFSSAQIAAGLAAPDADPDGDGVINAFEFAYGGQPSSSGDIQLPMPQLINQHLQVAISKPWYAININHVVETRGDLSFPDIWTTTNLQVLLDTPSDWIVRDSFSTVQANIRYMRVQVVLLP